MDTIAQILSIVGCLNWGLVGLFQFDLVAWIFGGSDTLLARIIYCVQRMQPVCQCLSLWRNFL